VPEAKDPNNTEAAFDENWASATEAGEHLTQNNFGAWVLAPVLIREALLGGCPAVLELDQGGQKSYALPPLPTSDPTSNFWFPPDRLRWVNALNPSMRREDYFDRPWPWELRVYLSPSESQELRDIEGRPLAREQVRTLRVLLRRAPAIEWGLLPPPSALPAEPPRVEPVPPPKPASALTSAVEPKPEPAAEHTRWQRDRVIAVMKEFYSPHGIRPTSVSIQALTDRINRHKEFQGNQVSHDTVRLADIEIKAAPQK